LYWRKTIADELFYDTLFAIFHKSKTHTGDIKSWKWDDNCK